MNPHIEDIRRQRLYVIDYVKELSIEKLNLVPHGFNNNIIWNLGHFTAAQQSICYLKGGLSTRLPQELFSPFMPSTRPDRFYQSDEADQVKELLLSSVDGLQGDYQGDYFQAFTPWTNRYGSVLKNIDDAIAYLAFHEGLHHGVIMSLRKLVQK